MISTTGFANDITPSVETETRCPPVSLSFAKSPPFTWVRDAWSKPRRSDSAACASHSGNQARAVDVGVSLATGSRKARIQRAFISRCSGGI